MDIQLYSKELFQKALSEGLTDAEVWYSEGDSFTAKAMKGEIEEYKVSSSRGLGLRGTWQGRMGYASTHAFDEESIRQLIEAVKESAELTETDEQDEIFAGEESYPEYQPPVNDIASVSPEQKLAACLELEKAVSAADERVSQVKHTTVITAHSKMALLNTYGLDLGFEDSMWMAGAGAVMPRGEHVVDGWGSGEGHLFSEFDACKIARKAAEEAASMLDVTDCPSGEMRVLLHRDAMRDLLSTFCGIFSARSAQQGLSLLKGREGEKIASDIVTIIDDPLLPGGAGSCPFDAEGTAARMKNVVENGVLMTLLHNRKTARIDHTVSTGNAARGGLASAISVSPTNLFFKPGERTPEEMVSGLERGIVITSVSGLHAGADAVSGDFSLLSRGYLVEDGKRTHAVERFTVAGNFYRLLENIREIANDLDFDGTSVGACMTDAGELVISGQSA